jgi:hypothetical protein
MNYWYVSQAAEILIDMDKPGSSLPHSESRLRGAISGGLLSVKQVEVHRSFTAEHLHLMVTLDHGLSPLERAVWALLMHSDIYRACNTLMRVEYDVKCPDLLITPVPFERKQDAVCFCVDKHDGKTMQECPAATVLREDERTRSFFGRPDYNPNRRVFPDDGQLAIFDTNVVFQGQRFS